MRLCDFLRLKHVALCLFVGMVAVIAAWRGASAVVLVWPVCIFLSEARAVWRLVHSKEPIARHEFFSRPAWTRVRYTLVPAERVLLAAAGAAGVIAATTPHTAFLAFSLAILPLVSIGVFLRHNR